MLPFQKALCTTLAICGFGSLQLPAGDSPRGTKESPQGAPPQEGVQVNNTPSPHGDFEKKLEEEAVALWRQSHGASPHKPTTQEIDRFVSALREKILSIFKDHLSSAPEGSLVMLVEGERLTAANILDSKGQSTRKIAQLEKMLMSGYAIIGKPLLRWENKGGSFEIQHDASSVLLTKCLEPIHPEGAARHDMKSFPHQVLSRSASCGERVLVLASRLGDGVYQVEGGLPIDWQASGSVGNSVWQGIGKALIVEHLKEVLPGIQ